MTKTILTLTKIILFSLFSVTNFNLFANDLNFHLPNTCTAHTHHTHSSSASCQDVATLFSMVRKSNDKSSNYRIKKIVIDPGHGGHDGGCSGANSTEKHIALAVSKKIKAAIELVHPDVQVIMTRDRDVFVPLHERAAIANRNDADLFISIHCNSFRGVAYGSETYVLGPHRLADNLEVAKRENASILLEADYEKNYDYDPNSAEGHIIMSMYQNAYQEQSLLFADRIEKHGQSAGKLRSRGVKQAGFLVLRETAMPSVLVETGYLTHAKDERVLLSASGQNSIATSILKAFNEFKDAMENGSTNAIAYSPISPAFPDKHPPITANPTEPSFTERSIKKTQQSPQKVVVEQPLPTQNSTASAPKAATNTTSKGVQNMQEVAATYKERTLYNTSNNNSNTNNTTSNSNRKADEFMPKSANTTIIRPTVVQFRVQLAASKRPIDMSDAKWENIQDFLIQVVQEDGYYKYQAVGYADYQTAVYAKQQLANRGFGDTWMVAYRNGEKITVSEALKKSMP